MTVWRTFYQHLMTDVDRPPIRVEHTVPPVDVVPAALTADATPADRIREALRLVEAALTRTAGRRNTDLEDLCLDIRSALGDLPPLGIRAATPVIPGGTR